MTSFNTIDRIPATANKYLMRDLLRGEMGFDGVLITDYSSMAELVPHGIAEDRTDAARLAMQAGVDIDMASVCYARGLPELVNNGVISEAAVDEAVMRVLRLKNELGLFEDPFRGCDSAANLAACNDPEAAQLMRSAAADSFVMIKNENVILPLDKDCKNAFIGPYVHSRELHGAWSNFCDADTIEPICSAVSSVDAGAVFAKGCPILPEDSVVYGFGFGNFYKSDKNEDQQALLDEAVEAARNADRVVMCLGEHRLFSGEGASRVEPQLPAHQVELLRRVHEVNDNIVLVIFSGRPLILTDVMPMCKAAVMAWFPGVQGAGAIADVLYGEREPGGRLAMCLPRAVGQTPMTYRELSTGRPIPHERPATRFVSMYQDCMNSPLYPFGFGLGYTEFACSEPVLSSGEMTSDGSVTVSAVVTNTGKRAGKQVVQLYIRDLCGSVCRPVKELRGVHTIELEPGESREVSFEITEPMLRFYTADMKFESEPGRFRVWVGFDSSTDNSAEFKLV